MRGRPLSRGGGCVARGGRVTRGGGGPSLKGTAVGREEVGGHDLGGGGGCGVHLHGHPHARSGELVVTLKRQKNRGGGKTNLPLCATPSLRFPSLPQLLLPRSARGAKSHAREVVPPQVKIDSKKQFKGAPERALDRHGAPQRQVPAKHLPPHVPAHDSLNEGGVSTFRGRAQTVSLRARRRIRLRFSRATFRR